MTTASHASANRPFHAYSARFYRHDLQAVRAVSVLLIMIYHIWLGKVSGGVDAFFVISGFLMGSVLLQTAATQGAVSAWQFWKKLLVRILPAAYFVLFCSVVLTLAFIPPPMWKFGVLELIASSLFIENWELVRTATNYLARENPPSQFQQYWALAVQMQTYVLLPILMLCSTWLAARSRRHGMLVAALPVAALALLSLAWSIYATHRSPDTAYFSTLTRLWEPLAGVLAAFAYPAIKLNNRRIANALYAFAFAGFVVFGLIVPSSIHFPGWIATIPVMLTLILILCGDRREGWLAIPAFSAAGNLSFTLYLWHWPILVVTHYLLGTTALGVGPGLTVIALALIAAWFTNRYIERSSPRVLPLAAACAAMLALGIGAQKTLGVLASSQPAAVHPLTPLSQTQNSVNIPFRTFVTSNYDRPYAISNCLGTVCEFGNPDAAHTVVLLGSSHAAHWQPAFEWMAQQRGFHLVTVLSHANELAEIDRIHPELVITTATSTIGGGENVAQSSPALWSALAQRGIKILALRDTPRFTQHQNACVWKHRDDAAPCAIARDTVFAAQFPAKPFEQRIPNLQAVDLTDLVCDARSCPAVHDDILIYYDTHHFSNSYMKHVAATALQMIDAQAPGLLP
ncbi:MAG: acyltransferase [Nevskiaceae bacterium]|jgi:peptidoglycan/LPS O-acetylase OafA/YrhL|nr:acyltransferase [Nevskiaceae bacterium]